MAPLLEVLTRPNVGVNSEAVHGGGNSIIVTDIVPETWRLWTEFNYATLTRIFRRELADNYQGSREQTPLDNDLRVCNEETLEDLLRRWISPPINYALSEQAGSCHYGRGSRCGSEYRPDWSVISNRCLDEFGSYANVAPGDTKLDAKWWPTMIGEGNNEHIEWRNVVSQIMTYMAYHRSRPGRRSSPTGACCCCCCWWWPSETDLRYLDGIERFVIPR